MERCNYKEFFKDQNNYYLLYILFLYAYVMYYLVQWPIFAGDSDLWYHLNGGRYILEHGVIPKDSSFFSFIAPPREWVDYYWLFQVLVYKIYSFSGYYGLVFLRAIIFIATILIVYLILNRGLKNKPDLYATILFSLFVLFLLSRFHLIRPHIFTYFFMALSIYILEFKKKYVVFLPPAAIIWVNLHGIVYPVLLLITMAYLVEFFFEHLIKGQHMQKDELFYVVPLVFTIAAVFCTPHGTELMWVPFIPTGFASLYIQEIKHIKPEELLSFQIIKMAITSGTAFNLLFFASCIAVIVNLFSSNRRVGHLLMFAGGIVLLTKASRFRYECALLSLPVLKDFMVFLTLKKNVLKPFAIIVVMLVMLMPALALRDLFTNFPKYPFSHKNLPEGICTFLNKMPAGGTVFNHPNHGGYLQWMLYPKYRIFMDMEIPFLFQNEDIFTANNAFSTGKGLSNIIETYHPSFIIVPLGNGGFKGLITKHPEYKVVFFDETCVLYVNGEQFPKIAYAYELKEINPYAIAQINIGSIIAEKREAPVLQELQKLIGIYSGCGLTNQLMALLYNKKGVYDKSMQYAENIINNYPETSVGYKLKGDALQGLKEYENALSEYSKALGRTVNKVEIYREIGTIYMKQQKYVKAYKTFRIITDPFSGTDYKYMYDVCLSAALSGNLKDAEILFRYAYPLVPSEDREWNEKYARLAEMIKEGGKDAFP